MNKNMKIRIMEMEMINNKQELMKVSIVVEQLLGKFDELLTIQRFGKYITYVLSTLRPDQFD